MSNISLEKGERAWYQENFHYHSLERDGEQPLEKVVEGYKHQCEYDFITFLECLTSDEQELFEEDDEFLVEPWY
jgi:hypothetical protein